MYRLSLAQIRGVQSAICPPRSLMFCSISPKFGPVHRRAFVRRRFRFAAVRPPNGDTVCTNPNGRLPAPGRQGRQRGSVYSRQGAEYTKRLTGMVAVFTTLRHTRGDPRWLPNRPNRDRGASFIDISAKENGAQDPKASWQSVRGSKLGHEPPFALRRCSASRAFDSQCRDWFSE
jgi:hypothetical protein